MTRLFAVAAGVGVDNPLGIEACGEWRVLSLRLSGQGDHALPDLPASLERIHLAT